MPVEEVIIIGQFVTTGIIDPTLLESSRELHWLDPCRICYDL